MADVVMARRVEKRLRHLLILSINLLSSHVDTITQQPLVLMGWFLHGEEESLVS